MAKGPTKSRDQLEVTTEIPTSFRAGETVKWRMADSADFPQASSWTAKATINGAGGNKTITAEFADGYWTFTLTAAENNLTAGDYYLYPFFTKGAGAAEETYPIGDGASPLTVLTKLSTATTTDLRTHDQIMLAKIEDALEAIATHAVNSMEIAGRTYTRENMKDLYALRNYYQRKVSGNTFQTIPVVFEAEGEN